MSDMGKPVTLTAKVEITITPQMRWAAYDVLSKWYSDNSKATSGGSMMDLSDQMILAALLASTPPTA